MKYAFFSILVLFTTVQAFAHRCETECSESCSDLVQEYETIIRNHRTFCQGNPSAGCAGKLATKRPYWSASELASACASAPADCILDLADARPYWSASEVNTACKGGHHGSCAGRLAVIRPYWSATELATACVNVDPTCVLDLAKTKPYWSASELNSACKTN